MNLKDSLTSMLRNSLRQLRGWRKSVYDEKKRGVDAQNGERVARRVARGPFEEGFTAVYTELYYERKTIRAPRARRQQLVIMQEFRARQEFMTEVVLPAIKVIVREMVIENPATDITETDIEKYVQEYNRTMICRTLKLIRAHHEGFASANLHTLFSDLRCEECA